VKLSRVHGLEWVIGLGGLAVLAGLLLPWEEGRAALAQPGVTDVLLALAGAAALVVPAVVAASRLTDVPVAWETLLWLASLVLGIVVLLHLIDPPEGGYGAGFWLSLAGILTVGLAGWRSVRRES